MGQGVAIIAATGRYENPFVELRLNLSSRTSNQKKHLLCTILCSRFQRQEYICVIYFKIHLHHPCGEQTVGEL